MKTAIVVTTAGVKFKAVAIKGALADGMRKMAELGYDGVELAVRDPAMVDAEEAKTLAAEFGVEIPALGTGQAYGEEGLSFTSPDADIRSRAAKRIRAHVELAEKLGAMVIIGLIRGTLVEGVERKQAVTWMKEALAECARFAEPKGVRLVVEPLNRYETSLLNTAGEAVALAEEIGAPNVGLLVDTFHMNIEEPSIEESIREAAGRIWHVHVADSNRWAPGAGHIDFRSIVKTLREIGYEGYLSVEAMAVPSPEELAVSSLGYLRKMLSELQEK